MPVPASPSLKCSTGRTRVYVVLAIASVVAAEGCAASTTWGPAVAASVGAAACLLIALLLGEGVLLKVAVVLVDVVAAWVEWALTLVVGLAFALIGLRSGSDVVSLTCGIGLGGAAIAGLVAAGYQHHRVRGQHTVTKSGRGRPGRSVA